MTRPIQTLLWMSVFTVIIAVGGLLLIGPLQDAYSSNIVFNTIILVILIIGIAINFRQVLQLYPEIAWIEAYQTNSLGLSSAQPKLLSSMARMLEGKEDVILSTTSMRTILDSIRTRLDDSRDLSRYLIGVLIFLGLLGTFWGLMATVSAVGTLISGMSVETTDGATIFENLKSGLSGPLSGMGIAFSSSLFGLSGSLVVGFLDLQAGHAQNRFVNELEEWLSSSTRISSGIISDEGGSIGAPAYVHALLEKTADALEKMQKAGASEDQQREFLGKQLREQNELLDKLNQTQNEIVRLLKTTSEQTQDTSVNEELRSELRLMTKTIANALSSRGGK
ncbi:MAG: flagellar motor protein MotA [Proteobacteria bacterium]|nr:flagellar motor protein MotA [Pseudomonadota bacterium]NOG61768.1 flagellar motor protein MotA [Pseudomonadota bacterium]